MLEFVPSRDMREFFEDVGFTFTDFQKATLIWNVPGKTWKERCNALEELAGETKDENLKKQIRERLAYEAKIFKVFQENAAGDFVYVVQDTEEIACGFFTSYDLALQYALKYEKEYEINCSIHKQHIVKGAEDEIARMHGSGNPYMGITTPETMEYDGSADAFVSLNQAGEIKEILSYELSKEEEDAVSEYNPERFEFAFLKIPFEMQKGSLVKDVTRGKYGVLANGAEEWKQYMQRVEDRKLYVDYSDVQVLVYMLTDSGFWSHEHINPMHLKLERPELEDGGDWEEKRLREDAFEAFSFYLSNERMAGEAREKRIVLETAKEYAAYRRRKEHPWIKRLEEAKDPEEIMD